MTPTTQALLPLDAHVHLLGDKILRALHRRGVYHQNSDGSVFRVSFCSAIGLRGGGVPRFAIYQVDMDRLWHFSSDDLTRPDLLRHLQAVLGLPLKAFTDNGVTYVVELAPKIKVRLPDSIHLNLDEMPSGQLMIPIGQAVTGGLYISLAETQHVLIGGVTQMGKTSLMQSIVMGLLSRQTSADLQLAIIDPKSQFIHWYNAPHLLTRAAVNVEEATSVLKVVFDEMERRRKLFASEMELNINDYNAKMIEHDQPTLPWLVVLVDEFVDLVSERGKSQGFITLLRQLSSKSASFGIRLILSATHPKADVVDSTIRTGCTIRVAFYCNEDGQSETILGKGMNDAARLPAHKGRMLVELTNRRGLIEVQGFFVDKQLLERVSREICGDNTPPNTDLTPVLTEDEMKVARMVLAEGVFSVRLARDKAGVSHSKASEISKKWGEQGWLGQPDKNQRRPLTRQGVSGVRSVISVSASST